MKLWIAWLLLLPVLNAQTVRLRVYSEFQRIDPFGAVVAADRGRPAREILSPAVARNAYASFHVVLTAPPKAMYFLAVQAPPSFRWSLYEEKFVRHQDGWTPDALVEARPPYFGVFPDPEAHIAGQTTRVYLLDLWVPGDMPPGPARVEVLAKVGYWRVAPMEVRVQAARVPDLREGRLPAPLPPVSRPADAPARAVLDIFRTQGEIPPVEEPDTVRSVIWRNAAQDMALARVLGERIGMEQIVRVSGGAKNSDAGAESYLKIRDYLYREASAPGP